MADLETHTDECIKAFKSWSAQGRKALESFMRDSLDKLAAQLTRELIETPIDSRLHSRLRRFRKTVCDFDKIEPIRRKDDDANAERIFREELKEAGKL